MPGSQGAARALLYCYGLRWNGRLCRTSGAERLLCAWARRRPAAVQPLAQQSSGGAATLPMSRWPVTRALSLHHPPPLTLTCAAPPPCTAAHLSRAAGHPRSTSCAQCWAQTRRTRSSRSTSAGRWTGWPGWSRRSRRCTCALGVQRPAPPAVSGGRATLSGARAPAQDRAREEGRASSGSQLLPAAPGGARTLTFMLAGARLVTSFCILCAPAGPQSWLGSLQQHTGRQQARGRQQQVRAARLSLMPGNMVVPAHGACQLPLPLHTSHSMCGQGCASAPLGARCQAQAPRVWALPASPAHGSGSVPGAVRAGARGAAHMHHRPPTSGEDHIAVQVLADVDVALHDGVEGGLVDAAGLHAHHAGREQHLWAPEPLAADGDHLRAARLPGHGGARCGSIGRLAPAAAARQLHKAADGGQPWMGARQSWPALPAAASTQSLQCHRLPGTTSASKPLPRDKVARGTLLHRVGGRPRKWMRCEAAKADAAAGRCSARLAAQRHCGGQVPQPAGTRQEGSHDQGARCRPAARSSSQWWRRMQRWPARPHSPGPRRPASP